MHTHHNLWSRTRQNNMLWPSRCDVHTFVWEDYCLYCHLTFVNHNCIHYYLTQYAPSTLSWNVTLPYNSLSLVLYAYLTFRMVTITLSDIHTLYTNLTSLCHIC